MCLRPKLKFDIPARRDRIERIEFGGGQNLGVSFQPQYGVPKGRSDFETLLDSTQTHLNYRRAHAATMASHGFAIRRGIYFLAAAQRW